MPYIKQEDRKRFEEALKLLAHEAPKTPGELNYIFSMIASIYITAHGEKRYQYFNDILGALEGAKLEIYRRLVAPYEDSAIKKNGDL